jgi:hypothetical protein
MWCRPTDLASLLFSKIHQNHKCDRTHAYITAHYWAITCATALLPTLNDSADSIYLLLAAAVSLHGRSTNHLITPCIYQNINPEFYPNSWFEKHGVTLHLRTKLNTFCTGIFLKTEASEGGRVIFIVGYIWYICTRGQTVHMVYLYKGTDSTYGISLQGDRQYISYICTRGQTVHIVYLYKGTDSTYGISVQGDRQYIWYICTRGQTVHQVMSQTHTLQ